MDLSLEKWSATQNDVLIAADASGLALQVREVGRRVTKVRKKATSKSTFCKYSLCFLCTVHPWLFEPRLSNTSILRMQNLQATPTFTKATWVVVIVRSCKWHLPIIKATQSA